MPDMHALDAESKSSNGAITVRSLRSWSTVDLLWTETHMPESQRNERSGSPSGVGRSADEQIATIEALALQHFPKEDHADVIARMAYVNEMLKQRLREYVSQVAKLVMLEVR